jgi:glycosyltransferase involved in cell wall biosynthesis
VEDFPGLVRRCGCQIFVADHVRKKVDLPLTLLEGLAQGLGLLALDFKPLNEIFEVADAEGLEVGARLPLVGDEAQFASEFSAALPDEAAAKRWRADAHALIAAHFSSKRLASAYQTLYRQLNDRHGQSKLLR